MRIIMPFNPAGVPLDKWIANKENEKELKGMNYLYIIQRKQDEGDFTKFGISTNGDMTRLKHYVQNHGKVNNKYKYQGVLLFALYGTKTNKTGYNDTTVVRKVEVRLIAHFQNNILKTDRGFETIKGKPELIYDQIRTMGVIHLKRVYAIRNKYRKSRTDPASYYEGGSLYVGKTPRDLIDKLAEEQEVDYEFPSDHSHDGGNWYYWYSDE
jgi:hypothetical protein